MHKTITIQTRQREVLVDITAQVKAVIRESGVRSGLVQVYAQGATAAILIQENWDDSVQTDVIHLLQKMIPKGVKQEKGSSIILTLYKKQPGEQGAW